MSNNNYINETLLDEDLKKKKPTNKDEILALINQKKKQAKLKNRRKVTVFPITNNK